MATIVALIIHGALHSGNAPTTPAGTAKQTSTVTGPSVYTVRAGDTLASIAGKTGVGKARLLTLNPKLHPTSLFLGEKIRLR